MSDDMADALDAAPRQGADRDEPEGSRFVVLSDTLAKQFSSRLRERSTIPLVDGATTTELSERALLLALQTIFTPDDLVACGSRWRGRFRRC